MATYGVTISDTDTQREGGSDRTARSMRPSTDSDTQSESLGGIKTRIISDANSEIESLSTNSSFHPRADETDVQVEGNVAIHSRWDDPRNNFLNPNISSVSIQMIANSLQKMVDFNTEVEALVHS